MIRIRALSSLAALAICATASASNFSVSGPGGTIPITGSGGPANWQTSFPPSPAVSSVTVANAVTSVTSVVLTGLTHSYIGDVQMVLRDPNGAGHNIVVRPGANNTTTTGCVGNYLLGNYTFVDPGTPGALQLPTASTTTNDQNPGTYEQAFGVGVGLWTSGNLGVDNVPLSTITGPAGTWTLTIYDWWTVDSGSFTGWTLNGTDGPTGTGVVFCVPGVGTIIGCPCLNPNGAGAGCANTGSTGGLLGATGNASLAADSVNPGSVQLTGTNMLTGTTAIFVEGPMNLANGLGFGGGIRCASGQLVRLYVKQGLVAGAKTVPEAGDFSISNQTTNLFPGMPITSGSTWYYQAYYRDPGLTNQGPSCPPNATFNITSGRAITWGP